MLEDAGVESNARMGRHELDRMYYALFDPEITSRDPLTDKIDVSDIEGW